MSTLLIVGVCAAAWLLVYLDGRRFQRRVDAIRKRHGLPPS